MGVDRYRWVQWNPRLDAFCITAVAGIGREQALQGFQADPATATPSSFADAFSGYPSPSYVLVDEVPGGVLAAENNGWQGADADVATGISRGGTLASYYRSVNADTTFVHAVDGSLLASFDPLLDDVPRELSQQAQGLPFGEDDVDACAFALLERLTGIGFDEAWLDSTHTRYDVPSPY